MKLLRVLVAVLCLTVSVSGQTAMYNPNYIEFSGSYFDATHFQVDFWAVGADITTAAPIFSYPVAPAAVIMGLGTAPHRIPFSALKVNFPAGLSYQVTVKAFWRDGTVSAPSNLSAPMRWSTCVKDSSVGPGEVNPGVISLMKLTLGTLPPFTANQDGFVPLTIESVSAVHSVTIDMVGDGLPAWSFYRLSDMRGIQGYILRRLPRAGRYLMTVSATDEQGCSAEVGNTFVTVQ